MQSLIYFVNYPDDTKILKALVVWLWVTDTAHTALVIQAAYTSLVPDFCNYARVANIIPGYLWQILPTSLVALPSQIFFTYRIGQFSNRKWIFFALLAPAAAYELAGALAFIAFGAITPTDQTLVSVKVSSIFTAVQGTAAGIDILISASLVYLLYVRWENVLPRSKNILRKLLILSINTGSWTALFAIFTLITILVYKNTLIYAALYYPLCPLYCNTVLANLNARTLIRDRLDPSHEDDASFLTPVFVDPRFSHKQASHLLVRPPVCEVTSGVFSIVLD
ncbi:hypothetical protein BV22DRAFT_533563 [Leucogyrophana mollusca]|uniref:Uncharacterized protein n=1 Tax=Leucogyrophana mollusca TaxID=85980 RepID=A0ACB8BGY4_9AGAM|nr:hypothetical protein BV22DRAFT_533563 [Leucogyrophana mollusca]